MSMSKRLQRDAISIKTASVESLNKTVERFYEVEGDKLQSMVNIFSNHNFEFHRIEVKKGGFCSKHKH